VTARDLNSMWSRSLDGVQRRELDSTRAQRARPLCTKARARLGSGRHSSGGTVGDEDGDGVGRKS
jgi:hypothetical protein